VWLICELLFNLAFDALIEGAWKVVSSPFKDKSKKEPPPVM